MGCKHHHYLCICICICDSHLLLERNLFHWMQTLLLQLFWPLPLHRGPVSHPKVQPLTKVPEKTTWYKFLSNSSNLLGLPLHLFIKRSVLGRSCLMRLACLLSFVGLFSLCWKNWSIFAAAWQLHFYLVFHSGFHFLTVTAVTAGVISQTRFHLDAQSEYTFIAFQEGAPL